MLDLDKRSITYLPGVGPKKADILQKEAGISSYEDLLFYFPYKYIDRSRFYKVAEISGNMPYIQLKGQILYFDTLGEGRSKRLVGKFSDGTGTIDLVWFKGLNYVTDKYRPNTEYIVFGKPTEFGHTYNIPHPDIDSMEQADQVANGLTPFYNTSEKMKKSFLNSRAIQNLQYTLLSWLNWELPETLSPDVLKRIHMMSMTEAMRNIHFPESAAKLRDAQLRLKFDELFFIQLNILRTASVRKLKLKGIVFPTVGHYFNTFYKEYLPFELTNAQKRVVREIRIDMGSGRQMNRLLQGDVGSGKTLVGLLSMLLAIDNHCQACMMAPTEILATQHYATIMGFLKDMDVKVALLTGSTKKKERDKILPAIASGEIQIVIGTHALIEETVVFSSLGLAIIDEQHRFGVAQRRILREKGQNPDVLMMTATPIPRTLAITAFGDMDVSIIDQMPAGRKEIITRWVKHQQLNLVLDWLVKEIQKGSQAYVISPLIEESEALDLKNAIALEEELIAYFGDRARIALLHGKMKGEEKEAIMQAFKQGEIDLLVSTTVIEVGVNVPNATVMMIENAERFGLAQLHQLRGRVGRGKHQSYCILVDGSGQDGTRERLTILSKSNDGFFIASEDLKLRGPGDIFGLRQSGDLEFKLADIFTDANILKTVSEEVNRLLDEDPELSSEEHAELGKKLNLYLEKSYDKLNL